MKRRFRKRVKRKQLFLTCHFCDNKTLPYYQEVDVLKRFTSERGRILAHSKTGVCSKHQRRLTREIKRARHIAILPFVV